MKASELLMAAKDSLIDGEWMCGDWTEIWGREDVGCVGFHLKRAGETLGILEDFWEGDDAPEGTDWQGAIVALTAVIEEPAIRAAIFDHNDDVVASKQEAIDWIDRAIAYAKEQENLA